MTSSVPIRQASDVKAAGMPDTARDGERHFYG